MSLKEKIEKTLSDTQVRNINEMLQYIERHGYYTCRSSSHNHWEGGAAQHMWATYLMAKSLRDQRLDEPAIKAYATDRKLAVICLLHDLCDMYVPDYNHNGHHGEKSYWIMKELGVGTIAEQMAVRYHMHADKHWTRGTPEEVEEYEALHSLIAGAKNMDEPHKTGADHMASGTAWNSTRYKQKRTQHEGVYRNDDHYLRAVAMDRTVQSANFHLYMDKNYEQREYRNFNRDHIRPVNFTKLSQLREHPIPFDDSNDAITAAHEYAETGKRPCIVVKATPELPQDKATRLRQGNKDEQDVLICSNILNAFYKNNYCREKGKRHRYEFTMHDTVKQIYRDSEKHGDNGLYLSGVTMIRDGKSQGFPFVEPWTADILLIFDGEFPAFVVPSDEVVF